MIQFINEGDVVSVEEMAEVYFNDHRVKRILKSMWTTNSGIALPSLVLLIPILASFMDPSRDFILFLCLGLFPSICVCQTSAIVAKSAKHNRSVRLLKASAILAVCYIVLASLGLIAIGALLVLSSKSCERPTCVSDAICSGILCLITVVGIVYNIIYAKLLILAIWYNEVLQERANTLNMEPVILDDGPISTISAESHSTASQLGFSYLRMEHPTEVFP